MSSPVEDEKAVADLDTRYQAAFKINDADTIAKILHDKFVLVTGSGSVFSKADLIKSAQNRASVYEKQDEEPGSQIVRVWGDTAIVTAKLWLAGKTGEKAFNYKLWFSDTYVRTSDGWKCAFGQASLPLPP